MHTQPPLSERDDQVPENEVGRPTKVIRFAQQVGRIAWPRIRDAWTWCVEWMAGLAIWCLAGLNLLSRLALQRWSRARRERKSQRNSAGSGETESAVTISMPAETVHSTAIDTRRKQVLAGPRRASNLSTTRRAAVSAALLLLAWYSLTPGRETSVTFDGPAISLTPDFIGPEPPQRDVQSPADQTSESPPDSEVASNDAEATADQIAKQLEDAERMRDEALEGLPPALQDAIRNPDADVEAAIDRVTRHASKPSLDATRNAGIRTLLAEMEPDVVAAISKQAFLRNHPRARLESRNAADGLENYMWGDTIAQNHAVTVNDVLVSQRTSVLRGDRRNAEQEIDDLEDRLGPPDSARRNSLDPASVVRVALWRFEELGFSLRCTVREGAAKNGARLYWFERGVFNFRLTEELLKQRPRSSSRPGSGKGTGLHKAGYSSANCLLCSEVRSPVAKRDFSDDCGFGFCDRCGRGLAALRTGVRLKKSGVTPSAKLNNDIRQFTDFMRTCFSRDDSDGRRGLILMSITSFTTPEWHKLTGCGD